MEQSRRCPSPPRSNRFYCDLMRWSQNWHVHISACRLLPIQDGERGHLSTISFFSVARHNARLDKSSPYTQQGDAAPLKHALSVSVRGSGSSSIPRIKVILIEVTHIDASCPPRRPPSAEQAPSDNLFPSWDSTLEVGVRTIAHRDISRAAAAEHLEREKQAPPCLKRRSSSRTRHTEQSCSLMACLIAASRCCAPERGAVPDREVQERRKRNPFRR